MGHFFDDVAHEFRNPITAIKGFASILEEGLAGELSSSQRDYLRIVCARADDLNRLVDNMLDLSRIEAALIRATRRQCTVDEIIGRVQAPLARRAAAANIALTIDADGTCPSLYGDPEQIGRALSNLAFNAFKSSGENGRVEIKVQCQKKQAALAFSVADSGPTMPAERRRVLLDRFREGASLWQIDRTFNLALGIVGELVKLNLGDIDVTTNKGPGNLFAFAVPIFDTASILPRYLRRFEGTQSGAALILDMTISLAPAGSLDVVEPLLQEQTGAADLLFRTDERTWRLLAPVQDSVAAELRDRTLRETLRDHTQEVGETKIPEARRWSLPIEPDDLIATFGRGASRPTARKKKQDRR
jgi:His Kinase A (phospho-acceptor) domain/Histidine kinase-, DNA gyrase B-, and HSP90-like ATPase